MYKTRKLTYEVYNCCMIEICKEKQIKKHVSPSSLAHVHLTNYEVIKAYWTYAVFVRFVERKVENRLTWFFICFSKKKKMKYGLTCFFM